LERAAHGDRHRAGLGKLDGIVEQGPDDAFDLIFITDGAEILGGEFGAQQQTLLMGERLELLDRASYRVAEIEGLDVESDLARVERVQQQYTLHQVQQFVGIYLNAFQRAALFRAHGLAEVFGENRAVADDRTERRAQLVRQIGQEVLLHAPIA